MDSSFRTASYGDSRPQGGDHRCVPSEALQARDNGIVPARDVYLVFPSVDEGNGLPPTATGPIMAMPRDIWRLIITYMPTSEAMSLRSTAHVVHRHLNVFADAILRGSRLIDVVTQPGNPSSMGLLETIDTLLTFTIDARCELIKRYARAAGLSSAVEPAGMDANVSDSLSALRCRYFTERIPDSGSEHAQFSLAWQRMLESTKSALFAVTFDKRESIALANLYAAEMYAPLLGVICTPSTHIRQVMQCADVALSRHRWMDFLHALNPLRDACPSIRRAYATLAANFDRTYGTPRVDVLASIVHATLTIRPPKSVRDVCLKRIGIAPRYLAEHITPRVTESIAASVVALPLIWGTDVLWRLRMLAARWGDDDGSFAASIHQSFLTVLAKNRLSVLAPWQTLSEKVRIALRTRVLGLSLADTERYGLEGCAILNFWGLYFEVSDPRAALLSPEAESRMNALSWPLRATLWRLAAEVHAYPRRAASGWINPLFHTLTAERVDAVCAEALAAGEPGHAIAALQATVRWDVTRACHARHESGTVADAIPDGGSREGDLHGPVFSSLASMVFERCTRVERLPLLAALFSYRDILRQCDHDRVYEPMISEEIVSLLCDPMSALVCPSGESRAVLLHYLPMCEARLPEGDYDRNGWDATLAHRLDLPLVDVRRAIDRNQSVQRL